MNAPEIINPAQLVLQHATDAMSATDVARTLYATDRPTKLQILNAGKNLKELGAQGLIEMEPRAGGVPFYRLIAAPEYTPVTDDNPTERAPEVVTISPDAAPSPADVSLIDGGKTEAIDWTAPELQYLAQEDYETPPPADPKLLAMANRAISDQLDEYRAELSSIAGVCADYLPDPSDLSTASAVEIMDLLIDAQHAHIQHLTTELAGSELCRDSLRADSLRLDAWRKAGEIIGADSPGALIDVFRAAENEADALLGKLLTAQQAHAALRDPLDSEDANSHAGLQRTIQDLRDRAVEQAEQYKADIARMAAEIDALRADNEALMRDPIGYLVRAAKRQPRTFASIDAAREAAMAAIRAGAQRAEVCPMLAPVGVARKGAEWRAA
jgi:hypothetical protein